MCVGSLDGAPRGLQGKEMLSFKSLPVLLGVFAVLLTANPAAGSIVKALELEELVGQSEQIVVGRVVFSESFVRENGNLGTWHRIQIERDIRGSAPLEGEVIVETLGGRMGDIAMRVRASRRSLKASVSSYSFATEARTRRFGRLGWARASCE